MTDTPYQILLVDDDPSILAMLSEWLGHLGYGITTASDATIAISLARQRFYHLVITDLKMPGLSGLQMMTVLHEISPNTVVIFLSGSGTMNDAIAALREGRAFDFLRKPIRDYHELSNLVARALSRQFEEESGPKPDSSSLFETLSEAERRIVVQLARGLDNQSIASELGLSEKTVRNRLSVIYDKLGVHNRTQALLVCQEHGLL